MKKITTLLFVVAAAVTTYAQEIEFKIVFKENTTYNQALKQTTNVETSYQADQEILDMLAAQGVTNPTVNNTASVITTTIITGKTSNGAIPLRVGIKQENGDGKPSIVPAGTKIYGSVKPNHAPVYDSIHAPGMDATIKEIFFSTMKSTAEQLYVPARKVKVGESFTVDTPLKIPAGPIELELKTSTTYSLVKVEGKRAYFDLKILTTMDNEIEGSTIKGSGTGTGSVIYDIAENFIISQKANNDMTMDMDMMGIMMKVKTKNTVDTTTTISK